MNETKRWHCAKVVAVQGYYGNPDYGKRVYWLTIDGKETDNFVWIKDLDGLVQEWESEGVEVEIVHA